MKRFTKQTKMKIKFAIDIEQKHRAELEKQLELSDNMQMIKDIKSGIQCSIWKEKFYRYAFNLNLEEMNKYHNKMNKWWQERDDEASEAIREGKNIFVSVNQEINGQEDDVETKENGYLLHCKEMKASFDEREKFIEVVTEMKK